MLDTRNIVRQRDANRGIAGENPAVVYRLGRLTGKSVATGQQFAVARVGNPLRIDVGSIPTLAVDFLNQKQE